MRKTLVCQGKIRYNYHMVISWFGLFSFKISSGPLTVITDPFSKSAGPTPPRGQTDIVIISNSSSDLYNNRESVGDEKTFVVDSPGEYDVKGLFIRGVPGAGDPKNAKNGFDYTTIYAIRMEDMRLGFLGSLKQKELSDQQLEDLGDIDVLFVPVGGKSVCDAEEAVTIVNQIEPRFVIPMHYTQSGLKITLDKVDQFLKEIGGAKAAPQEKLTIKKSNILEGENTEVVILEPQR